MTSFKQLFAVVFVATGATVAASAEYVDIDARSGTIANGPDKVYRVSTATGSGAGISFIPSEKTIQVFGIEQAQDEQDAVLKLASDQTLSLTYLSITNDSTKGITVGDSVGSGVLSLVAGAPYLEFLAGSASANPIVVNASLYTDISKGEPLNRLLKNGAGSVELNGAYAVSVTNLAGQVVFHDQSGTSALVVSGDDTEFAVSSVAEDRPFYFASKKVSGAKENATVFITREPTSLMEFKVINGSVALCRDADFFDIEISADPERYTDSVPDCCSVASNTVGVLELERSHISSKVTIGGSVNDWERSYGAIYLRQNSSITNYCSTIGEWLFGLSGYAYLEIGPGCIHHTAGKWYAGRNGQFNLVVDGGEFSHVDSSQRLSGFGIGGTGADATIYVSNNGVFDASGVSEDPELTIASESTQVNGVQVSVDDGGVFSVGRKRVVLGPKAVMNVNEGGTVQAASVSIGDSTSLLQCDGGTVAAAKDGSSMFYGRVVSQSKGCVVDVPKAMTVGVGSPVLRPDGKGVESIELPEEVAAMRFIGAPVVRIEGNGVGATAVCEFDAENQTVTAIKVTGRGEKYTKATARILYGYGAGAVNVVIPAEMVTLTPNVSGGLTKSGLGTLLVDSVNTYTGATTVAGGVLSLKMQNGIPAGNALDLRGGGVLDLNNQPGGLVCSDLRGDGTGYAINGIVTLDGLNADLERTKAGIVETLNLTNVEFSAEATVYLANATDDTLDRTKSYELYRFEGPVPERMPMIDPETYANGLSEAWGITIEDNKAYLRYFGGSIFIYY